MKISGASGSEILSDVDELMLLDENDVDVLDFFFSKLFDDLLVDIFEVFDVDVFDLLLVEVFDFSFNSSRISFVACSTLSDDFEDVFDLLTDFLLVELFDVEVFRDVEDVFDFSLAAAMTSSTTSFTLSDDELLLVLVFDFLLVDDFEELLFLLIASTMASTTSSKCSSEE